MPFKKEEQDVVNGLAFSMVCIYELSSNQTPEAHVIVNNAIIDLEHTLKGSKVLGKSMSKIVNKAWKAAVKKIRADLEGSKKFSRIHIPEKCPFTVDLSNQKILVLKGKIAYERD